MMSPVVTENSAGIPLHSYLLPQTGGSATGSPFFKMISENLVVPVGLAVVTHPSSSQIPEDIDLDKELKEIPDALFDQCLGLVSERKYPDKQTSRKKFVGKKRASKRSWF